MDGERNQDIKTQGGKVIEFLRANTAVVSLVIAIIALVQPWMIALWKKLFRGPKIEIYPSGNPEIGYSEFGPTFGLHGTLRAIHGDVFVKRIRVRTKKVQTNEEHWLAWVAFRSPVIRFNPTDVPPMELPASFIVSQTQPHRFNIVFFDPVIQEKVRPLSERLNQAAITISQNNLDVLRFSRGSGNWGDIYRGVYDQYSRTQEVQEAFDQIDRHCYWQPGRYELEVHIDSNKRDSQFKKRLAFQLTQQEVDRLRLNRMTMIENPFRIIAGEQIWNFNFVYPAFEEE